MANARCHARFMYVVRHNFWWCAYVAIFWGGGASMWHPLKLFM
jgi:hypothetical protein